VAGPVSDIDLQGRVVNIERVVERLATSTRNVCATVVFDMTRCAVSAVSVVLIAQI